MKKICVITGTRADYGLLKLLIKEIYSSKKLLLQLVATGSHLSPEFGSTYEEIIKDGFKIDYKVEMLLSSDTSVGVAKSIGVAILGFADVFEILKPDLVIILGDRYEMLAAANAALIARIQMAHIHGGELTEGAFDDAIRHSLTKMSLLHFVAADEYWNRVVQLGENPKRVFLVGGLGVDSICKLKLISKVELQTQLRFKFAKTNILVTFHPTTLEKGSAVAQLNEILAALNLLSETKIIFTMPNADTEGRILFKIIEKYVSENNNSIAFVSLGQLKYLSLLKIVDIVIGNSSSGLLEAPSFKKATINIGKRQDGRLKAISVIDCIPNKKHIFNAIKIALSDDFKKILEKTKNPYGDGGASKKIVKILENVTIPKNVQKSFYDIKL